MERDTFILAAGAFLAVLLQLVLAPNIALFSAMPNFCMIYALIAAITRPAGNAALLVAFAFGMLFDLLGNAPVGAMAFLLVLAAFGASRVFTVLNNDTLFMPLAIFIVAVFLVEVFYAVFMVSTGIAASLLEALVLRALPCAFYNCAVGLPLLAFVRRLFDEPGRPSSRAHDSMHVSLTSGKNLGKVRTKHRF
ncbi:MAG: rod shape-determining protein MreD [Eggerthellaceae bacterium]|jgi:rod shape-determining protein MreD|nr:rod shape-determining protein MreD [Eggerthellaceae bacterium]MDR2715339.1 rod shape-determining protein MreD [Coriobacteriaceae bacterium]